MVAKAKDTFDFFRLARELRDMVYDDLLIETVDLDPEGDHQASLMACGVPAKSHLLVNRQFNSELQNRAARSSLLSIEERVDPETLPKITLQGSVTNISRLKLRLLLMCDEEQHDDPDQVCRIGREVEMHEEWIKFLLPQMKHLRSLSIELHLTPGEHVRECEQTLLTHLSTFVALAAFDGCKVFHCNVNKDGNWNYDQPKPLVMTWSRETGILQAVEQKE